MTLRPLATSLLLAAGALSPTPAFADDTKKPASPEAYYRYETEAGKGGSGNFEVLTRRFRHPKTGREVTLAGMVHVADAAFYTRVEKLADTQDVVLLEGVRPGESLSGVLTALPLVYASQLGPRLMAPARLEDQMDHLRATGANRRNADVTLDRLGDGPGLGLGGLVALPFLVVFGETAYLLEGAAEQLAFFTGNGPSAARLTRASIARELIAKTPEDMGEDFERIILKDRNDLVLRTLDEELAKPGSRRILIPWGAAHHPELEAGLLRRGFLPVNDEWTTAIAVRDMDKSRETASGFLWRVPYAMSLRFSDTTDAVSGPLSLIDYKSAPRIREHSSAWGLLHRRRVTDEKSSFSLLAGVLWTGESRRDGGESESYALLGLWGASRSPARDETRLGWWGFLGGAHTDKDDAGAELSSGWHLPLTFGKIPLLYAQNTDADSGETERRFLIFFRTTSGK